MSRSLGVTFISFASLIWLNFSGAVTMAAAQPKPVMVYAAASLKTALDDARGAWERDTGKAVTIVYAGSNVLAKQIEAGAPADLFISADLDWMDYAASRKFIRPDSRIILLGNTLVLIAPKDSTIALEPASGLDLPSLIGSGRLAMGNVDAVPAGKYGKAALEKLGQWEGLKGKVAQAESVRGALLLVSRGEAPMGVVYGSDARADASVKVLMTFPADSHPPIVYPAAITADSQNPDAAQFLSFLGSLATKPLFEAQGFVVLNQPAQRS
jgi:molybdate transport system substrate-binding protein